MAHIDFSIEDWVAANVDLLARVTVEHLNSTAADNTHAALSQLVDAIKNAENVYCGWTVKDAEEVRLEDYPDRADLSISDSHNVIVEAATSWDASYGFNWDCLHTAYRDYVHNLELKDS